MSKKTGTKKLTSNNIVLRRFKLTDYFSIKKWYCNPDIIKYTITRMPPNNWDIFKMVVGRVRRYVKKDYYCWAIVYNGKMSGLMELLPIANKNAYSVSYKLDIEINGRGITTKALKMVIEYLKTQGVDFIIAVCDVENTASRRVMEKAGMSEYGSPETNGMLKYADNTLAKTYRFKYVFNNN